MDYGLRVNHHAADHGRLILDGIRPALRAIGPGCSAALRPHWLGGPHVLVAMDPAVADAASAWAALAASVQTWLDDEPPRTPLDVDRFLERAKKLAAVEGLEPDSGPLRPDRSVERGRFAVPHPLGAAGRAPLRDRFKAATLEDVFDLVERRLASSSDVLIELAFRFVCLERLRWRDGLNFWPLSLQGQARASRDAVAAPFANLLSEWEPRLAARVEQERVLDEAAAPPVQAAGWIARLQTAYEDLLRFLDAAAPTFVVDLNARLLRTAPPDPHALSKADRQTLNAMNHPTQFAYRMLMNFLYDMFPAVGLTAGQRLLVCHLVTTMLEQRHPHILARSYAAGAALCR